MPPVIHLCSDAKLDKYTIQASPGTIRELRLLIGNGRYRFEDCLLHSDDQVTVSPELYDAFDEFLTSISDAHHMA